MDNYLLLLFLVLALWTPTGHAGKIEAGLIKTLLTDYDISARPINNISDAIVVNFGLALRQIVNLDERQQQLKTKVWLRLRWTDDSLMWNKSDYGGIESVYIFPYRIWKPDITLYDNMDESPGNSAEYLYPAVVQYNGKVSWSLPRVLTSNCDVDISHYPWDEQICPLKFGSWNYDGSQLDLRNRSASGDLTSYTPSSEWYVLDFDAVRSSIVYACCPEPFYDVTLKLHIRRKPMYYIINLVLPSVFISLMAVLVFYLPTESGEKVGLAVTILLALTVFLLIVAELTPKTEIVPLIARYYESVILLMAISAALTVIVINVHHRGMFGNEVPAWLRKFVLNWMARALWMKQTVDANISPRKSTQVTKLAPIKSDSVTIIKAHNDFQVPDVDTMNGRPVTAQAIRDNRPDVMQGFQDGRHSEEYVEACKTDWMLVAAVIDRFLLVLFAIVLTVATVSVFLNRPYHPEQPIA